MAASGLFTEDEINKIFSNVDGIVQCSKAFLDELSTAESSTQIGKIFLKLVNPLTLPITK